jgi:polar amino acid transport system substrate-binding protein
MMKVYSRYLLLLVLVLFGAKPAFAESLANLEKKGVITIAAYEDYPPYSYRDSAGKPKGIDVDIAKALASELGLSANVRLVFADESLGDDLRVYVWKGHHVTGPAADVMMHVPYDDYLIKAEDKVNFIAPYAEVQVVVAADAEQLGASPSLTSFFEKKIGVEKVTMADGYLRGAYNGRMQNNVIPYNTMLEATQALLKKELSAVMGDRSQIEFGLGEYKKEYQIGLMQLPNIAKASWDLSLAVKSDYKELSKKLEMAMDKLLKNGTIKEIYSKHDINYHMPAVVVKEIASKQ